jgi:hypothetical protein
LQSQELDDEDEDTDMEPEVDVKSNQPVYFLPREQTPTDDSPIEENCNPPTVRKRKKMRMVSGERRKLQLCFIHLILALITRQWSSTIDRKLHSDVDTDTETESNAGDLFPPRHTVDVLVNDTLEFVSAGVESIIEDQVTSRFKAAQLASWNLLSRSKRNVQFK